MQTSVSASPVVHDRVDSREFLGLAVRSRLATLKVQFEELPPGSCAAILRRSIIEAALPQVPACQAVDHIFAVLDAGAERMRAEHALADGTWKALFAASSATRIILEMTGMLDSLETAGVQHQVQGAEHRFALPDERDGPTFPTVQQAIRAAHTALALRKTLN